MVSASYKDFYQQIAQSPISIFADAMYCHSQEKVYYLVHMQSLTVSTELISHSQECGLCYQNIEQSLSKYSTVALDSSSLVKRFMNQSARGKPGSETHSHIATSEGTLFDGYRRVQVIFTSIGSIQKDSVLSHPIEAFPNFVALFRTATKGQLPYLADLKQIGLSISDYNNRQANIPQLSLVETKRWHKQMAEELLLLQQAVSQLMHKICADERSARLLKHIYQSKFAPSISPSNLFVSYFIRSPPRLND